MDDFTEQQSGGETSQRIGIAPFKEMPSAPDSGAGPFRHLQSGPIPIGPLGFVNVSAQIPKDEYEIQAEHKEDDIAISVDEQGRKIEINAREAARKGHFEIYIQLITALQNSKGVKANLWIEGKDLLVTDTFYGIDDHDGWAEESPASFQQTPGIEQMRAYQSNLTEKVQGLEGTVSRPLMLPRIMLPKIRVNIEQEGRRVVSNL